MQQALAGQRHPCAGRHLPGVSPDAAMLSAAFFSSVVLLGGGVAERAPVLRELEFPQHVVELDSPKPLLEALADAEFAIIDRNLRITGRLHIGAAIRERGYTDFPDYEVLLFCNLSFTRPLLERSPVSIYACPGRLAIRQEHSRVIVSATLFPEDEEDPEREDSTRQLNELIREIVRYAAYDR